MTQKKKAGKANEHAPQSNTAAGSERHAAKSSPEEPVQAGGEEIADISALVGRHFVASSLNTCRVERIGVGGLRIVWDRRDTEADRKEFEDFAQSVLGPFSITRLEGGSIHRPGARAEELAAYGKWKRTKLSP